MTRLIQPLNLLPLSWGKTICVGCGSAPNIIEVMLQRPYGVRGLGSLRFSRREEKNGLHLYNRKNFDSLQARDFSTAMTVRISTINSLDRILIAQQQNH